MNAENQCGNLSVSVGTNLARAASGAHARTEIAPGRVG